MTTPRWLHRAVSFAFAAIVTLGVLGGIDGLSQPPADHVPQWAQQAASASRG